MIGGIAAALISFGPVAYEVTWREWLRSKAIIGVLGAYAVVVLVMGVVESSEWVRLPWVAMLLLLSGVDIKTKSIHVRDLAILFLLALITIPVQAMIFTLIWIVVFSVFLVGVKVALSKWYKQNVFGGADIIVILTMLIALSGRSAVIGIYVAIFSSAIVGGVMMVIFKQPKKTMIPFVPFLTFGAIVSLLFSDQIYRLYLQALL